MSKIKISELFYSVQGEGVTWVYQACSYARLVVTLHAMALE
jgi:organic radical activating enzyme